MVWDHFGSLMRTTHFCLQLEGGTIDTGICSFSILAANQRY